MQNRDVELNTGFKIEGFPEIAAKIGLHTAIGDKVNSASRRADKF